VSFPTNSFTTISIHLNIYKQLDLCYKSKNCALQLSIITKRLDHEMALAWFVSPSFSKSIIADSWLHFSKSSQIHTISAQMGSVLTKQMIHGITISSRTTQNQSLCRGMHFVYARVFHAQYFEVSYTSNSYLCYAKQISMLIIPIDLFTFSFLDWFCRAKILYSLYC
jgi:hypothetical protein